MRDTLELVITHPLGTELHAEDIGVTFTFTSTDGTNAVDISTMDTKEIIITAPAGTHAHKSLDFVTDGTNGASDFVTLVTDFPVAGSYQLQGNFIDADGNKFHSNIITINVYANLVEP
jgi:hypothetical protein